MSHIFAIYRRSVAFTRTSCTYLQFFSSYFPSNGPRIYAYSLVNTRLKTKDLLSSTITRRFFVVSIATSQHEHLSCFAIMFAISLHYLTAIRDSRVISLRESSGGMLRSRLSHGDPIHVAFSASEILSVLQREIYIYM